MFVQYFLFRSTKKLTNNQIFDMVNVKSNTKLARQEDSIKDRN